MAIVSALTTLINESLSRGEQPLWIILKQARPTETDILWSPMLASFNSGNALIIDDVGLIRGHQQFKDLIDREEYKRELLRARNTPIDMLDLKLIRRLGHFRVVNKEKQAYCARHYFDGSECKDEIAQLIRDHIKEHYKDQENPIILYTDPQSNWLRDVVLTLEDCSSKRPMSVEEYLKEGQDCPQAQYLLVMPVIDTANTLASILQDWAKAKLPKPKIFSVISTRGDKDRNGSWLPIFDGVEYEVFYLLHRKLKKYNSQCPLCRLDIPHQDSGLADQYLSLTSYDFWDMVGDFPCLSEDNSDTPKHRSKPLKVVPPIRDIVNENGPWLAKKAVNLLKNSLGECRLKGIPIVHLQEKGAKPLPLYLRELLGATLIELPNWVRNELKPDSSNVEEVTARLRLKEPICSQQLDSVNPDQPVLVLEEFSVTGGTRDAIMKLLDHLRRTVLAHLCVLSFESPQARLRIDNSFCLYEFELPKEWFNNGSFV
ncbi:MAG: hypothetical protein HQL05_07065 [Nitrospirae bacterium]|uniref:hypothetical protein n=1 Tax=Candidatus Magnetobacterium casense TaxID=1455061 RepID=UPI00058B2044|nr:hypothetical protein [Candidatus Magnetobacterium casensis]MBF0337580.1 hypothetical protein [Nitrospirota bacterium]